MWKWKMLLLSQIKKTEQRNEEWDVFSWRYSARYDLPYRIELSLLRWLSYIHVAFELSNAPVIEDFFFSRFIYFFSNGIPVTGKTVEASFWILLIFVCFASQKYLEGFHFLRNMLPYLLAF